MNRRVQRLGFAFGGVLLVTILWVRLFPSPPGQPLAEPMGTTVAAPVGSAPATNGDHMQQSPMTTPGDEEPVAEGRAVTVNDLNLRTYAVSTFDLQGLPPDARPGTLLEVWVAWEPPIVESPRYQRLLREVVLEKVVPGLTPEAPATALLQVKVKELSDLLYADRWGQLSVAALP